MQGEEGKSICKCATGPPADEDQSMLIQISDDERIKFLLS